MLELLGAVGLIFLFFTGWAATFFFLAHSLENMMCFSSHWFKSALGWGIYLSGMLSYPIIAGAVYYSVTKWLGYGQ